MIDLTCDSPGCNLEAHTTAKCGGVDGWFAAFVDGRRINACMINHLQPAVTFANPHAICGHEQCQQPTGRNHLYCSEQCRDLDNRTLVGMAGVWGTASLAATIGTIRDRLAMVGAGY